MQTEDAGVKSSHPHFKFKKGNDMNDTVTKGNAAVLLFRLRNFRITGFAETACGRQSVSYHRIYGNTA